MVENSSLNFTNTTFSVVKEIWVTTEEAIGIAVLASTAAVVGSIGTLFVLVAVVTSPYLHTVPDFFIFSLSSADFLVSAIAQPMFIYLTFHYPLDATGSGIIITSSLVGHLALLASVTSMTAVTFDRFIAIRFSLHYPTWITHRRSAVAIVLLWLISLALAVVYTVPPAVDRMALWTYVTANLLVTIVIYVYIFSVAKRHASKIVNVQPKTDQNKIQQKVRDQNGDRKAAKTIAIIVGLFLLFWLPLILYAVMHGSKAYTATFLRGFRWVQVVSMCNSTINPFVYCIRSVRYRRAFARIVGIKNINMNQSLTFENIPKPTVEVIERHK